MGRIKEVKEFFFFMCIQAVISMAWMGPIIALGRQGDIFAPIMWAICFPCATYKIIYELRKSLDHFHPKESDGSKEGK